MSSLNSNVFENFKYLHCIESNPYFNSQIKNILKNKYVNKPNSLLKYLNESKIVLCSYPQTSMCESILTGPSILVYNFDDWPFDEKFLSVHQELIKNKIAFSNAREASLHINDIWDQVDEWWNSKGVKNAIEKFNKNLCLTDKNSTNLWVNFLKNEIKENL